MDFSEFRNSWRGGGLALQTHSNEISRKAPFAFLISKRISLSGFLIESEPPAEFSPTCDVSLILLGCVEIHAALF